MAPQVKYECDDIVIETESLGGRLGEFRVTVKLYREKVELVSMRLEQVLVPGDTLHLSGFTVKVPISFGE